MSDLVAVTVSVAALITISFVLIRLATGGRSHDAQPVAEVSSPILSDVPIRSSSEDKLGRVAFARRLADVVATGPADRGLVVGLEGKWGEGKTSMLQLV